MTPTPWLDALEDAYASRAAPVEAGTARAGMRAAFGAEQLDFIDDDHRFGAARTARAAGKTSAIVGRALDRMTSIRGWRGCYGALTSDSGQEQVWEEFKRQDALFGFGLKFHEHKKIVELPDMGSRYRIRSMENKRAADRWRGKQYHEVDIDECQSIPDGVLSYALISVIPATLTRFQGHLRLTGTPRLDMSGIWYLITGKRGRVVSKRPDGTLSAVARYFHRKDEPELAGVEATWSLHTWSRSSNPGLPHADRETDTMRRALAVTPETQAAISVELDGDWPEELEPTDRMYRFDPVKHVWTPGAAPGYGLPEGHEWRFVLAADLARKRDAFAIEVGAYALTSRVAYHVDEFHARKLEVHQMAAELKKFRALLGSRLVAMVGDGQGPTGAPILDELQRVHGIPIDPAEKAYKDAGIDLVSSDLVADRLKIKAGSKWAKQLTELRKPDKDKPASQQPKQDDDAADAGLYMRRRMLHVFGKEPGASATPDAIRAQRAKEQLRAMQRRAEQARRGGSAW
jgi:hypothetical protein